MKSLFRSIVIITLTFLAKRVLRRFHPEIIVVSGSVGKTGAKDAIYHLVKEMGTARKSAKSYNGEIGVPLTILGLENAWSSPIGWLRNFSRGYKAASAADYPKTLVLEVGSDHPGDITRLMEWLTPDIAVLTSLPRIPVHVEFFRDPKELWDEDAAVFAALRPHGIAIGNADDEEVLRRLTEEAEKGRTVYAYGTHKDATLRAEHIKVRYATADDALRPRGMEYELHHERAEYPVYVSNVVGVQPVYGTLAALSVVVAKNGELYRLVDSLMTYDPPRGRMRVLSGKLGSTLIDDTYNSSPAALTLALATLRSLKGKRKIAVLGDMLELGSYSDDAHWAAGREAGAFLDELYTVGDRARLIAEGAKSAGLPEGRIHSFMSSVKAGEELSRNLRSGDVVLLKGSQGSGKQMIRIERAAKLLLADPSEAKDTLVRQEDEWQEQYRDEHP